MKILVVAKHHENTDWTQNVPGWTVVVYDKGAQNSSLPNAPGREAHTYLFAITNLWGTFLRDDTEVAFCQGNPFDHCPDFLDRLDADTEFGPSMTCAEQGDAHWANGGMSDYCRVFGLPVKEEYEFVAGAQFKVTGAQIHRHPLGFYKGLLGLTEFCKNSAYVLERMWISSIFPKV